MFRKEEGKEKEKYSKKVKLEVFPNPTRFGKSVISQ